MFAILLPSNILGKIASIHLPTVSHGTDNCFWGVSSNRMFFVRFVYAFFDDSIGGGTHNFWLLV